MLKYACVGLASYRFLGVKFLGEIKRGLCVASARRKKTGSRRRNVLKEDLVAEDRKRIFGILVSSCSGPRIALHVMMTIMALSFLIFICGNSSGLLWHYTDESASKGSSGAWR